MKNNVICVFVDSVAFNSISTHRASVSPTPFLDSLKSESISVSNLYSHGPYTDAATKSLFTGRNCLDDFSYYFRYNTSPIVDYKIFHDAGYETYGFYYPFIMYGEGIKKHIDHSYYTSSFFFGSEWRGSFEFYSQILKERPLNKTELLLLKNRMNLFFNAVELYLREMIDNKACLKIHSKCVENYNISKSLETLLIEKGKYLKDSEGYIDSLLKNGEKHILWQIDTSSVDAYINPEFIDSIAKENISFFRKIKWNNFKANVFASFPNLKRIYRGMKMFYKTKDKKNLHILLNYKLCLTQISMMMKRWKKPEWQYVNSIHTILTAALDVLKNRDEKPSKPFYMSLMTEDPHEYLSMFAYDIQDKQEVNDEIRVLKNYVAELGTNFRGSLLYLLSLRYVDYEIEKFCRGLKDMGLWDTTTLVILTDHGSSYTFYPIHGPSVNCFDDECYHVPLLIRHPGKGRMDINTYCNSKDIYPTICDLVGIVQPKSLKGYSLLDGNRPLYDYVMTEYMGPGCPDMTQRRMWMSIRDSKYIVAYKVGIYEKFEDGELAECYDLSKDPFGYYNINEKIDRKTISYLLEPLKNRFEEIRNETNIFIKKLENKEIYVPI